MPRSVTARSDRVRRALAHRQARPGGLAGHVVWVYAITDGLEPGQLAGLTGVGGEPVRMVTEAGLAAVVGSVDAQTFGENARGSLLSDLASIERPGRAHHPVAAGRRPGESAGAARLLPAKQRPRRRVHQGRAGAGAGARGCQGRPDRPLAALLLRRPPPRLTRTRPDPHHGLARTTFWPARALARTTPDPHSAGWAPQPGR